MRHILFSTTFLGPCLFLMACASGSTAPEATAPAPVASSSPQATVDPGDPGQTTLPLPKESGGPEITLKRDDRTHGAPDPSAGHGGEDTTEKIGKPPMQDVKAAPVAHEKVVGVAPEISLRYLRNGNIRFRKAFLRKDGQSVSDIKRLTGGQRPHAVVISCSDSRVPPEVVFDQKLGEIFVVRTAGQTLSPEVVASVEYAVEHLGTRMILVMGHTSCGAVHAVADAIHGPGHDHAKGALDDSPNIAALVKDLRPRIEETVRSQPSPRLVNESWANVRGAARELFDLSPYLKAQLAAGHIKVVGGLYDLESGAVDFK